jgi:hypothetical protein
LTRRAKDIQLVLIIKSLMKSNIFDRDKSVALAKSLTDDGEEAYRDKARDLRKRLHDTLMGAFGNHQIYFPLDEIIKSIDDRRLLTPSTPDSSPIQPHDSTPVHDSTHTQA